ncbi:MAG: DNA gyrase inhibitor YacG [Gallionella sp.]
MKTTTPQVRCPQCQKSSPWDTQNAFRPFCCERCKMIDLGKWANEEFRIEQPPELNDFELLESHPSLAQ